MSTDRCRLDVTDSFICRELRERLRIEDIIPVVLQNRLIWYGRVFRMTG